MLETVDGTGVADQKIAAAVVVVVVGTAAWHVPYRCVRLRPSETRVLAVLTVCWVPAYVRHKDAAAVAGVVDAPGAPGHCELPCCRRTGRLR